MFCLMFVLFVFVCPILASVTHGLLGRIITNLIFFWPQMVLLPYGVMNNKIGPSESYGFGGQSFVIAIIFWVSMGLLFSWFTRHLNLRGKTSLVYPFIIAVTICVVFIMYCIGYSPYLDGP